jgi:RNA 3'-terminal phosphate cyclase
MNTGSMYQRTHHALLRAELACSVWRSEGSMLCLRRGGKLQSAAGLQQGSDRGQQQERVAQHAARVLLTIS